MNDYKNNKIGEITLIQNGVATGHDNSGRTTVWVIHHPHYHGKVDLLFQDNAPPKGCEFPGMAIPLGYIIVTHPWIIAGDYNDFLVKIRNEIYDLLLRTPGYVESNCGHPLYVGDDQ